MGIETALTRRDFLKCLIAGLFAKDSLLVSNPYAAPSATNTSLPTQFQRSYMFEGSIIGPFFEKSGEAAFDVNLGNSEYSLNLVISDSAKTLYRQNSRGIIENGVMLPSQVEVDRDYYLPIISIEKDDISVLNFEYTNEGLVKIFASTYNRKENSYNSKEKIYPISPTKTDLLTAAVQTWFELKGGNSPEKIQYFDNWGDHHEASYSVEDNQYVELDLGTNRYFFQNFDIALDAEFNPVAFSSRKWLLIKLEGRSKSLDLKLH